MVCSLRRISNETDELDALLGDVAFIMGEFDTAESRYLETGQYDKALTMRRDLHEWPKAMTIAEKFNSPLLTDISREYAAVAEYKYDNLVYILHSFCTLCCPLVLFLFLFYSLFLH